MVYSGKARLENGINSASSEGLLAAMTCFPTDGAAHQHRAFVFLIELQLTYRCEIDGNPPHTLPRVTIRIV